MPIAPPHLTRWGLVMALWPLGRNRTPSRRPPPAPRSRFVRPQCHRLEARETPADLFSGGVHVALGSAGLVAGAAAGGVPLVGVHDPLTGQLRSAFLAFDANFSGGVFVAAGGDGTVVAGAGEGGSPLVSVFDAAGNVRATFLAFDAGFSGGVRVASADIDGDGTPDIIAGAGPGGSPQVRVFSGRTFSVLRDFVAFTGDFAGGVTVAAADLTGDGRAEIVVGAGAGGAPLVQIFDGASGQPSATFLAFDANFSGGITVAATSASGGRIVVGADAGGVPVVSVFDEAGRAEKALLAFDQAFNGGVWVGAGDVNGDGTTDIAAGAGPGATPVVRALSGVTQQSFADFHAFEGVAAGPGGGGGGTNGGTPSDAVAPTVVVTSPAQDQSFATNPTFQGRATDDVGVTAVEVQIDGGAFQAVSFDAAGNFTFTSGLATDGTNNGPHTAAFRARDAAGNVSALFAVQFVLVVDLVAPTVTITAPPNNQTVATNPTFEGMAFDGVALASVEARVDGGAFAPVTFDEDTGEFDFTTTLATDGSADGPHTVDFRATDAAGNVSAVVSRAFTLEAGDTTAPLIALTSSPNGQTVTTNPTAVGTVTDDVGVATLEARVDGGAFAPVTFDAGTGAFTFTTVLALDGTANGLHTIDLRASDAAGNTSALTTISFTLTAP